MAAQCCCPRLRLCTGGAAAVVVVIVAAATAAAGGQAWRPACSFDTARKAELESINYLFFIRCAQEQ